MLRELYIECAKNVFDYERQVSKVTKTGSTEGPPRSPWPLRSTVNTSEKKVKALWTWIWMAVINGSILWIFCNCNLQILKITKGQIKIDVLINFGKTGWGTNGGSSHPGYNLTPGPRLQSSPEGAMLKTGLSLSTLFWLSPLTPKGKRTKARNKIKISSINH
jgi:hypothetical protein